VKYVLLFVETEQFAKDLEAMDQADRDRAFMLAGQWFMEHADKVKGGSKLRPPDTATTVRLDRGDPVVLEADNLDEVLAMVKTWPGCPVVEIRPLES
jgi:hypothetical protein